VEYAAEHLQVPLVVVMGHTSCGAVKAAMETPPPAKPDPAGINLERILAAIRPSLERAAPTGDRWANAVYASVDQNLKDIVRGSPVLNELGESGKVMFVGAVYELESGKVNFSEPVEFRPGHSRAVRPAVSAHEERRAGEKPAFRFAGYSSGQDPRNHIWRSVLQ
jgi:carbonic anhydrase